MLQAPKNFKTLHCVFAGIRGWLQRRKGGTTVAAVVRENAATGVHWVSETLASKVHQC